jgi:formylmethanofuran:tetrahydromethanopterin formyltransferase
VLEAVVSEDEFTEVWVNGRERLTEITEDMLMGREMSQYPMCADEFLERREVKWSTSVATGELFAVGIRWMLEAVVEVNVGEWVKGGKRFTDRSEDMLMGREMLQYPMCADEFLGRREVK